MIPGTAHASFCGLNIDAETGQTILWVWGSAIGGLGVLFGYRYWLNANDTPERKALKIRLGELERGLASVMAQLHNADNYPRECGLTDTERSDRRKSAATIRRMIAEAKSEIVSI